MSRFLASPSASAAAAPRTVRDDFPSTRSESEWEIAMLSAKAPSLEQLHALTALPSGLVGGLTRRAAKGKRGKPRLAREGAIHSKMFDALGSRPMPTNGISLEQTITLELTVSLLNVITSSGTSSLPTYASKVFTISDFSGASSLTTVFDQYRIEQIETWLEFTAPNSTGAFPLLYSAVDLDDANVPTTLNGVQDHQGALVGGGPAGHYHKWKPHIAVASFSGAFTSYSNVPAGWIDAASPNVQHYGLKIATVSTGAAQTVNLTTRAVVSFRAPSIN